MPDLANLPGRRLPDAEHGTPGPGWDAWTERQPGDYMRVDFGERVGWYVCDPDGKVGLIGLPRRELAIIADLLITVEHPPIVEPWSITEHDDGTISVLPSIMDPDGWHGWLERGVWRSA
jgi:hypothetical protein